MSQIRLCRLDITGIVDAQTPKIVLEDIAKAHGIEIHATNRLNEMNINEVSEVNRMFMSPSEDTTEYVSKLINKINTTRIPHHSQPFSGKAMRNIGRFVNKDVLRWPRRKLLEAFNHLMSFIDYRHLPKADFKYGNQTPENPTALNSSVLYAICRQHGIRLNYRTTVDNMANIVKMLIMFKDRNQSTELTQELKGKIDELVKYSAMGPSQLINVILMLDPTYLSREDLIDDLSQSKLIAEGSNLIKKYSYEQDFDADEAERLITLFERSDENKQPETHMEAVVLAGIRFNIDIRCVKDPLAEYRALTKPNYFPVDIELAKRIYTANCNPDSIDNPYFMKVFNPEIPRAFYGAVRILHFCTEECYTHEEIRNEDAYSLLQISYLTKNTFVHGLQPNIANEKTTYHCEINELSNDEIICYGIRDQTLIAYTYEELTATFRYYKRFQNPATTENSNFDKRAIAKLVKLAELPQRYTEADSVYRHRQNLLLAIERVRLFNEHSEERGIQFVDVYDLAAASVKIKIETALTNLLHTAMYMRAWTGEGPYPIVSEDTNFQICEQINVDHRSTKSILNFEASCRNLGPIGTQIKNLPLIFYQGGGFVTSSNLAEGFTIGDRLNIIKNGDDHDDMYSCIRMSSNRLAASAYYYMNLIGLDPGFDIKRLAEIH